MRKTLLAGLVVMLALALTAPPASAVPFYPGVFNTYIGAGVAEDAGYFGAAGGTQAAFWGYVGSEVSLTAGGAAINLPQAHPVIGSPTPAGVIFEATEVKDGPSLVFGQELTALMGGLFPTFLLAPGALDNGLAPGSTAADGNPDQLPTIGFLDSYSVFFGPGSLQPFPYPGPPVFEIYDDVPPITDLDIGTVTTPLVEEEFDFDGAGPAHSPIPGPPSQFENGVDGFPLPNTVSTAADGTLWAAGFIDYAIATYTFFDPSLTNSGFQGLPGGATLYSVQFTGKGRVTEGAILPLLLPLEIGTAWDGGDINITFAATLFGAAYDAVSIPGGAPLGTDPFASWDIVVTRGGNPGDASFTILPIPEPSTMLLLGIGLVPLAFRRRKKKAV